MKTRGRNKDIVISLRISAEDFAGFERDIKKSGLSRSAFFRQVVLDKAPHITVHVDDSDSNRQDTSRLLYHLSKSGNNINQLARQVNIAYQAGRVTDKTFRSVCTILEDIRQHFIQEVNHADKGKGL